MIILQESYLINLQQYKSFIILKFPEGDKDA